MKKEIDLPFDGLSYCTTSDLALDFTDDIISLKSPIRTLKQKFSEFKHFRMAELSPEVAAIPALTVQGTSFIFWKILIF